MEVEPQLGLPGVPSAAPAPAAMETGTPGEKRSRATSWEHVEGGVSASSRVTGEDVERELRRAFGRAAEEVQSQRHEGGLRWSYAEAAGKIFDMRSLMKLPPFAGEDDKWREWKFRFENVLSLVQLEKLMKWS